MKLLLAGGRQARKAGVLDRQHRPLYDRAILASFETSTLRLAPWASYVEALPEGHPPVGHRFGAPSRDGNSVLACTEREVLRYGLDGTLRQRQSHPWMADVHHAAVLGGALHVACTGLDGVMVQEPAHPRFLPTHPDARPPLGDARWERTRSFTHPNYLWEVGGQRFATRGRAGDALRLDGAVRWPIAEVTVHDGLVTKDGVWFTAVDGQLLLLDPETGQRIRRLDLADASRADARAEPLGWCRGLWIADGIAWVGFTRIRTTTLRGALAWARGRLRGRPIATRRPTRLVGVDLATGGTIAEIPLQEVDLDVLMGITALE